jgi:hypothetical protein
MDRVHPAPRAGDELHRPLVSMIEARDTPSDARWLRLAMRPFCPINLS